MVRANTRATWAGAELILIRIWNIDDDDDADDDDVDDDDDDGDDHNLGERWAHPHTDLDRDICWPS